jgi:hypothetical protein
VEEVKMRKWSGVLFIAGLLLIPGLMVNAGPIHTGTGGAFDPGLNPSLENNKPAESKSRE